MKMITKCVLMTTTALLISLMSKPAQAWFQVCNRAGERIDVAFAYLDTNDNRNPYYNNGWVSQGWWVLDSGDCASVYPHELWRRNRYYYVYAQGNTGGVWSGNHSFCTIRDRFTIGNANNRCSGTGRSWKNFIEVDIGSNSNYTFNLTE